MRLLTSLALALLMLALPAAQAVRAATPTPLGLSDWAGFFVSGDYLAHSGAPSEVFDNGRRDVGKAFVDAGLKAENTAHFSVFEALHQSEPVKPLRLTIDNMAGEMTRVADKAKGGCVLFYTSHGNVGLMRMGTGVIDPGMIKGLMDSACPNRPSVVILSACFSGSFIPTLAAPNRVIMTAARADRTSFGCGEEDVYTFFDGCLIQAMPNAATFESLASTVNGCVERRETQMNMSPPSSPQLSIGSEFGPQMLRFTLVRSYVVKPGDTLKAISRTMYGNDGRGGQILAANREILPNERALKPGLKLKIPPT
jgi:hypothetical protein